MSTPLSRWIVTFLLAAGGLMAGLLLAIYFELPADIPALTLSKAADEARIGI